MSFCYMVRKHKSLVLWFGVKHRYARILLTVDRNVDLISYLIFAQHPPTGKFQGFVYVHFLRINTLDDEVVVVRLLSPDRGARSMASLIKKPDQPQPGSRH